MQEFRQYLSETVKTLEWQNAEKCKAAAKDIMDHFSETSGNMSRSILMNGIYQGLYAGFDAVSDTLQEKGIDGINLWQALQDDVVERYSDKQIVMQLATLTILAQEARNNNDVAFRKYKETNVVDETLITSVVSFLDWAAAFSETARRNAVTIGRKFFMILAGLPLSWEFFCLLPSTWKGFLLNLRLWQRRFLNIFLFLSSLSPYPSFPVSETGRYLLS